MDLPAEKDGTRASTSGARETAGEPLDTSSTPRRRFGIRDHLCALATFIASFLSGLLALSGYPWWAILPALTALIVASTWISAQKRRGHELPAGAITVVSAVFGAWLAIPLYRGIRHGATAPFPELLVLGGLAPAAWLVFYVWLLVRR